MKRLKLIGAMAGRGLAAATATQALAAAEDAIGTWKDTETGGITEVYSCPGGICIKVVTPSKGREKDDNNPDPKLKGRSMAGAAKTVSGNSSGLAVAGSISTSSKNR